MDDTTDERYHVEDEDNPRLPMPIGGVGLCPQSGKAIEEVDENRQQTAYERVIVLYPE
jgi:hypothetical protein